MPNTALRSAIPVLTALFNQCPKCDPGEPGTAGIACQVTQATTDCLTGLIVDLHSNVTALQTQLDNLKLGSGPSSLTIAGFAIACVGLLLGCYAVQKARHALKVAKEAEAKANSLRANQH